MQLNMENGGDSLAPWLRLEACNARLSSLSGWTHRLHCLLLSALTLTRGSPCLLPGQLEQWSSLVAKGDSEPCPALGILSPSSGNKPRRGN